MHWASKRLNDLAKEFSFKAEIWNQVSLTLSLGIYRYIPLTIWFICLKYLIWKKNWLENSVHLYTMPPKSEDICESAQQNIWHIFIILCIDFGQKEHR